jgi:hypothetical protein
MLRWVQRRWRAIKAQPLSLFLIGLLAGLIAGWFAGSASSVDRPRGSSTKPTAYTKLSNRELQSRALQLVSQIRDMTSSFDREDSKLRAESDKRMAETKSEQEQNRIRKTWLAESDKLHSAYMEDYNKRFWSDAVLLRDAIAARLPARFGSQNSQLFLFPTNMLGVRQVANSLELLAKSLPEEEAK